MTAIDQSSLTLDPEEAGRVRQERLERIGRWVLPLAIMILAIWLWDRICVWNEIPKYILPRPGVVLQTLYDDAGLLHHVGFTSAIAAADRPALTERLEALVEAPGFTGDPPGGPSCWSTERSATWQPLRPELVAEVRYDHVTGRRFRHGTGFLRWRPDKAPLQCTMEQLGEEARPAIVETALSEAEAER